MRSYKLPPITTNSWKKRLEILCQVVKHPNTTSKEIVARTGLGYAAVQGQLNWLVSSGYVSRTRPSARIHPWRYTVEAA